MHRSNLISLGWWGYFASATLYSIASARAGDWLGLLGSLFFFGATIAFILDHYRNRKNAGSDGETSK
jgi:hypothetical protein